MKSLVIVNAVGLTSRWLPFAPRLRRRAKNGWLRRLIEPIPAVTCTAQATILTGKQPREHGIVGNGWLFRDTGEVRFWQQSNRLIRAEPVYTTLRKRAEAAGAAFTCAKLFWWFNQGADVDFSVTPKPYYGADGSKVFGITGQPEGLTESLEKALGPFPFHTFWGPLAGRACTDWIAQCSARIIRDHRPSLTLVYLPHLDYDPQRYGPSGSEMQRLVKELDDAFGFIENAAEKEGAQVWVLSEYGHVDVSQPVYINRILRKAGLLKVRPGPFGETLDTFNSRAFAVCDHQVAHVYVSDSSLIPQVCETIADVPGLHRMIHSEERAEMGLDHSRSGEIIALARPDAWFAYPFWLDDAEAPDYARTVDIHRKPGYDPCELFVDPKLTAPRLRVARRLLQKKLGFRYLMDVVPLDAGLVKGSHGLRAEDELDRPILIGEGIEPPPEADIPMEHVCDLIQSMGDSD